MKEFMQGLYVKCKMDVWLPSFLRKFFERWLGIKTTRSYVNQHYSVKRSTKQ